jgi:hypothetical protein
MKTVGTNTRLQRKPTKRQLEIERREQEERCERKARETQHLQLLELGYVLVKGNEREHPAHSEELVKRIDALACYLGHGNYEPTSSHRGTLKRARRLWARGYSNFQEMLKEPEWWRVNARNQYPIIFPPDAAPLPASVVPDPVYVNGGSVLPYQPFQWGERL